VRRVRDGHVEGMDVVKFAKNVADGELQSAATRTHAMSVWSAWGPV